MNKKKLAALAARIEKKCAKEAVYQKKRAERLAARPDAAERMARAEMKRERKAGMRVYAKLHGGWDATHNWMYALAAKLAKAGQ